MSKLTYREWMAQVDATIAKLTGGLLDSRCLPDFCYADYYADGVSPKQAAKDAIKAAMEY